MIETMHRRAPSQDVDERNLDISDEAHAAAGPKAVAIAMKMAVEQMGPTRTARTLLRLNQVDGFDCQGCAWPDPDPEHRHTAEFCENGAKAVAEEATKLRVGPEFFAEHSLADLEERSEFWLGKQGRITEPVVRRAGGTHYEPISWDDAFALIAGHLRELASPDEAIFYTSGKTSNEAAFAYQLFVRAFGTNNLPDCSNMCHESTSVALAETIGIGKGSVSLHDVETAELIVIAGQNPGTNHPRMLSALEQAKKNGARIVSVNPLREAGLVRFKNPQKPKGWVAGGTPLADLHLPVRLNGDLALWQGLASYLLEHDAVDHDFVSRHTHGFEEWAEHIARTRPRRGGAHHRARVGAGRGARRDARVVVGHRLLLGDGHHPAPQRRRDDQGVRQRRADAGQHRQARRRPVPGARPLQRAGRPHHGHLGAPQAGVPRLAGGRVRLRPAARGRPRQRRTR